MSLLEKSAGPEMPRFLAHLESPSLHLDATDDLSPVVGLLSPLVLLGLNAFFFLTRVLKPVIHFSSVAQKVGGALRDLGKAPP